MAAQHDDGIAQSGAGGSLLRREAARFVPLIVAAVLFVVFVVENSRTVKVTFLFWKVGTSLAWALIVSGVLGFVAGLALAWFRVRRR